MLKIICKMLSRRTRYPLGCKLLSVIKAEQILKYNLRSLNQIYLPGMVPQTSTLKIPKNRITTINNSSNNNNSSSSQLSNKKLLCLRQLLKHPCLLLMRKFLIMMDRSNNWRSSRKEQRKSKLTKKVRIFL